MSDCAGQLPIIPPVRHRPPAFRFSRAEPRSEEAEGADALDAAAQRPVEQSLDGPASDGRVGAASTVVRDDGMICPSAIRLFWRTHTVPSVAAVERPDEMLA